MGTAPVVPPPGARRLSDLFTDNAQRVPVDRLDDQQLLTQYGNDTSVGRPFYNKPRLPGVAAMSLIRGYVDPDEAAKIVHHTQGADGRVARYTRAKTLRALGFIVVASPTHWNPKHVTVEPADGSAGWTIDHGELFDQAFAY